KVYSNFVYVLKRGERPEAAAPHFKTFSGMDLPYWREYYLLGEAEELAEKIRAKTATLGGCEYIVLNPLNWGMEQLELLAADVLPLSPRLDAPGFAPTAWPALPVSRIRFAGEPVAVVAAATAYEAADGAELIRLHCEPLPAVADIDAALAADAPRLHPERPDNVLFRRRHRQGDVDGGFAASAVTVA